jgi:hypothetical protein
MQKCSRRINLEPARVEDLCHQDLPGCQTYLDKSNIKAQVGKADQGEGAQVRTLTPSPKVYYHQLSSNAGNFRMETVRSLPGA